MTRYLIHPTSADLSEDIHDWAMQLLGTSDPETVRVTPVRDMAWSSVARVEHPQGVWYCKALPVYMQHELPLTDYLTRKAPDTIAARVGLDLNRGFLMVEDAGPMLREHYEQSLDPECWMQALQTYARLQIDLMHCPDLRSLSLPNRSLAVLPYKIRSDVMHAAQWNGDDEDDHLLPEHESHLLTAFDNWSEQIEGLYDFGITDTLNHGDLHDGNVAWNQRAVIFDWGDASLSHPFVSLRNVLNSIERRFDISVNSSEMNPFIEVYLNEFRRFAPMSELRLRFERVRRLWSLVTYLGWCKATQNQDDPRASQYNYARPALLRECAQALTL